MLNSNSVFNIEYLAVAAIFAGAGYGIFDSIRGLQPVSTVVLAQLPAGCLSDLLADKLAKGQKPVTRGEFEDFEGQCEKEAREGRAMAQRADVLQKQREALVSTNREQ